MRRCAVASAAIVFTLSFILTFLEIKAVGIICLLFAALLIISVIIKNKALIFAVAFCLAAGISSFLFGYFGVYHDSAYNGMDLEIKATVKRIYSDDCYVLQIEEAKNGIYAADINGKVMLYADLEEPLCERDIISGSFSISTPSKTGSLLISGYPDGAYLQAHPNGDITVEGFKEATFFDVSYNLRQYIQNVTRKIGKNEGGLVLSLLTGNKEDISKDIQNAFKDCGLSHIMAVSGMHLSVVANLCVMILDRLEVERKLRQVLCIIIILFIMTAASFSYSVMRAGFMSAVVVFASLFQRRSDGINSLGVSVTAICLINPYAVMDIGFLLSASATFGILVIMPLLYGFIYKIKFTPLRWVVSCILVSVAATVGVLPAMAFIFSSVSFIGVILSVVTNIYVSLLIIGGLILCALHIIPGISHILIYLLKIFSGAFIAIAQYFSRFKFAIIEFNPLPLVFFFIMIFLMGLLYLIPFKEKPRRNFMHILGSAVFAVTALCSANPVFSECNLNIIGKNHNLGVYAQTEEGVAVLDCTDISGAKEIKNSIGKYERIKLYFLPEYSKDRMEMLEYFAGLNKIEKLIIPDIDDNRKYDIIEMFKGKNTQVILAEEGCSFSFDGISVSVYPYENTGFISYLSYKNFSTAYFSKTADPSKVSYLPKADMLVMNGSYLSSINGILRISPKNITVYNASYGDLSSFKINNKEKNFPLNEVNGGVTAAIEKSGKFTVYGETK